MEVKPYNIFISLSYPPDTDTPGYQEEMLSKPTLTKKISESGSVFSAVSVAESIVDGAQNHVYTISTGLDGWFLKQPHSGMTPVNNLFEVTQQIVFASLLRFVGVFYLAYWDFLTFSTHREEEEKESKKKNNGNSTRGSEEKKEENKKKK
jgi:3-dehydrosphinganine reductase